MSQSKNNQDLKNELLNMPDDEFYKLMEDAGFELVESPDGKGEIIFTDYAVVKGVVKQFFNTEIDYGHYLEIKKGDGWRTLGGELNDLGDILAEFNGKRVRLTVWTIEDWE